MGPSFNHHEDNMNTTIREATMLTWSSDRTRQIFVRHAASDDKTLCGIDLGRSISDPPGFENETVEPCNSLACRRALAAYDEATA
jgi:hypothetical protein